MLVDYYSSVNMSGQPMEVRIVPLNRAIASPVTRTNGVNLKGGTLMGRVAVGFAAAVACSCVCAQSYPLKTVQIILPYAAGGFADALARTIGKKLTEKWNQSVIVESKSGASGMIGTDYVAKSRPDGYTLVMGSTAELALNAAVYKKMPYDPERDLTGVILLSESPMVLVVNPAVPAKTVAEFITLAKTKPEGVSYGTPGNGSPHHFAGEWMKAITKINLHHIPYRGGAPQVVDLLGGHLQSGWVSLPNAAPHIRSSKLRPLAVLSRKRSTMFPEIPTLEEEGVRGINVSQWRGISAPAATPKDIIAKLNVDITETLSSNEVKELIRVGGEEPLGSTVAQFDAFVREEIAKFKRAANELNISAN